MKKNIKKSFTGSLFTSSIFLSVHSHNFAGLTDLNMNYNTSLQTIDFISCPNFISFSAAGNTNLQSITFTNNRNLRWVNFGGCSMSSSLLNTLISQLATQSIVQTLPGYLDLRGNITESMDYSGINGITILTNKGWTITTD